LLSSARLLRAGIAYKIEMLALNEGDSALALRITGLDRKLACKSGIAIPYSQISNVLARPEAAAFWFPTGVRFGTRLPGVVKKGSWFTFDSPDFFRAVSGTRPRVPGGRVFIAGTGLGRTGLTRIQVVAYPLGS
jgi:hypothetical protein